jgi:hypothetical protein
MSQIHLLIVRPKNRKRVTIAVLIEAIAAELERSKFAGEFKHPVRSRAKTDESMVALHVSFFPSERQIQLQIDLTEEGRSRAFGLGGLDWDYLSLFHHVVQAAAAAQFQRRTPPPKVVMAYQGYNVARWGETAE